MKLAWSRQASEDWRRCAECHIQRRLCLQHAYGTRPRKRRLIGPRVRLLQAKDVPEGVILDVLGQSPWPGHSQRRCYNLTCAGECRSLPCCAPELAAFPEKVLRAKLKAMRRRGLVDGCACGCRGDWLLLLPPP